MGYVSSQLILWTIGGITGGVQNWGTKWDAYTMEIDDTDMPHGFEVQFETAWSPPEEVCHAIREQFDDLSISWFYDERL